MSEGVLGVMIVGTRPRISIRQHHELGSICAAQGALRGCGHNDRVLRLPAAAQYLQPLRLLLLLNLVVLQVFPQLLLVLHHHLLLMVHLDHFPLLNLLLLQHLSLLLLELQTLAVHDPLWVVWTCHQYLEQQLA